MKRLISDAHYHLWKPSTHTWLSDKEGLANHPAGDLNSVGRDYNVTEFRNESSKYIIDKSVHVQCYHTDPLQETITLQEIANNTSLSNGNPHGIIAFAELESKDIEQTLLKHMRYPNFRGIRECLDYHPKYENRRLCPRDDLMMDRLFHNGLKIMAKYDLIFDMQLYPLQLREASVLAAAHPKLRIVINHCAMPMLNEDYNNEWENGLKLIAQNKNVFIKMSGWGIFDQKFNKQSMKYIIKRIINIFGVDRCMFASDFPVDKPHGKYDMYWDLYIQILKELNFCEEDIDKMVHSNTINVYRLNQKRLFVKLPKSKL
eukprot:154238_1